MCDKKRSKVRYLSAYDSKGNYLNRERCKVDSCIADLVSRLNTEGVKTLGCCCGHGVYSKTIVYFSNSGEIKELFSGIKIPRTRNFYFTDKNHFYFLPEVDKEKK